MQVHDYPFIVLAHGQWYRTEEDVDRDETCSVQSMPFCLQAHFHHPLTAKSPERGSTGQGMGHRHSAGSSSLSRVIARLYGSALHPESDRPKWLMIDTTRNALVAEVDAFSSFLKTNNLKGSTEAKSNRH